MLNSNTLPEFPMEPRELPRQTKLVRKKNKLHRFQFCTKYGDKACMYSRVFGVSVFKYATKNFKVAKGVAIPTKFTKKNKKHRFEFGTRLIVRLSGVSNFKYATI